MNNGELEDRELEWALDRYNGWEEMTKCVTVMISETFPGRQHQARSPRLRQKAYMHSSLTKSVVQIGWTSFATVYSLASTWRVGSSCYW